MTEHMTNTNLPELPEITYSLLRQHLGPVDADRLCGTIWKDGIDIEEPRAGVQSLLRAYALAALAQSGQGGAVSGKWDGAEEWMPLAWELCADECGEEACTELVWEGGPIPEPWGDRWLQYEDEAKRLIALVRKHTRPQPAQPTVGIPEAMKIVIEAMRVDPDYAWSWHCNIAMAAYDEGVSHYAANAAAARFLAMLVPCLNTTKHAGFPEKSQASAEAVEPVAWQGLHDRTDLYYRKPAPAPLPELSEADVLERCAKWCDEQPRSFSYGRQASDMVRRFAADIAAKKGNAA